MTRANAIDSRSGFTLLEMMISLTILAFLGYCLLIAVDVGHDSQQTVQRITAEERAMRRSTTSLVDELRASRDASITITPLADGNHQVRFQMPIEVAGVPDWGVFDRTLGPDEATQNRVGWSLRYTVRIVPDGNGGVDRQLVRQILDAAQAVQRERVVATGLLSGGDVPPGFTMVRQGDIWELTLSTEGHLGGAGGTRAIFHVRTRNN